VTPFAFTPTVAHAGHRIQHGGCLGLGDGSWQSDKASGQWFAIVGAWGGQTANQYAYTQLAGARANGLKTAAYCVLNFNNSSDASADC
jgi:Glycosyl hydrolases family 25